MEERKRKIIFFLFHQILFFLFYLLGWKKAKGIKIHKFLNKQEKCDSSFFTFCGCVMIRRVVVEGGERVREGESERETFYFL